MDNSLLEAPFVPKWARNFKDSKFFIYNGPSMAPLFKPGDLLCAHKSVLENIRSGDIVIVDWEKDKNQSEYIVHRVISVKQNFLILQGDNNIMADAQVATNENLVGLVTAFDRHNHVYSIKGGFIGIFYSHIIHALKHIWLFSKHLGGWVYRLINLSRLVACFWKPSFLKIWLIGENGPWVKFIHHGRTIARWWPQQNRFLCRKPYDLVLRREDLLDESVLFPNKSTRGKNKKVI